MKTAPSAAFDPRPNPGDHANTHLYVELYVAFRLIWDTNYRSAVVCASNE
jgi:hypothetical protein